jgi:hypothetical protein
MILTSCCIASVLRFYYVYKEAYASTSSTGVNRYESVTLSVTWATIEPSTSVIAACLPTYGHLFHSNRGLSTRVRSFWSRLTLKSAGSGASGNHSSFGKSVTISNSANPAYTSNQQTSGRHWQWVIDKRDNTSEDIEMAGASFEDDHVPLATDAQPLRSSPSQDWFSIQESHGESLADENSIGLHWKVKWQSTWCSGLSYNCHNWNNKCA